MLIDTNTGSEEIVSNEFFIVHIPNEVSWQCTRKVSKNDWILCMKNKDRECAKGLQVWMEHKLTTRLQFSQVIQFN